MYHSSEGGGGFFSYGNFIKVFHDKLHGYTVHQTMLKLFYYQLMHIMLKNTELLKHPKITLQHVSVYVETIFRELQSVLG